MSEPKKVKKSYLELLADSQAMAAIAEEARLEELEAVIAQMKANITAYKITAEQLGFVLIAPTPPPAPAKPAKPSTPAKKQPATEYDEDGNSKRYLADGTRRPFTYFNPASKEKAYNIGAKPLWLKALEDSGVDPKTYTIPKA